MSLSLKGEVRVLLAQIKSALNKPLVEWLLEPLPVSGTLHTFSELLLTPLQLQDHHYYTINKYIFARSSNALSKLYWSYVKSLALRCALAVLSSSRDEDLQLCNFRGRLRTWHRFQFPRAQMACSRPPWVHFLPSSEAPVGGIHIGIVFTGGSNSEKYAGAYRNF